MLPLHCIASQPRRIRPTSVLLISWQVHICICNIWTWWWGMQTCGLQLSAIIIFIVIFIIIVNVRGSLNVWLICMIGILPSPVSPHRTWASSHTVWYVIQLSHNSSGAVQVLLAWERWCNVILAILHVLQIWLSSLFKTVCYHILFVLCFVSCWLLHIYLCALQVFNHCFWFISVCGERVGDGSTKDDVEKTSRNWVLVLWLSSACSGDITQ